MRNREPGAATALRLPARHGPCLGDVRIGISGWRYEPWRGVFYPPGLRAATRAGVRLADAADDRDQRLVLFAAAAGVVRGMARRDAARLRLRGQGLALHHAHAEAAQRARAARQLLRLGRAAPGRQARADPLAVPAAARLRRRALRRPSSRCCRATPRRRSRWRASTTQRLDGRAWLRDRPHAGRCATRSRSAIRASSIRPSSRCCARHRIALVVADTAGRWPLLEDLTADFVYVRLHGDEELYASGYGDAALDRWAARIAAWRDGGQVDDARLASPGAAAPRAGATCTATSTTTSRCTRRTTPRIWRRGSASPPGSSPASASFRRPVSRRRVSARLPSPERTDALPFIGTCWRLPHILLHWAEAPREQCTGDSDAST